MDTAELANTVVLITKEDNVRQAVSSTLEKAGYVILSAGNAASALALCREATVPIQLAIIDVGMDQIHDHGFLDSLRQAAPGIRVIFMSNSVDREALQDLAKPWKIGRVLRKPFRRTRLLGAVLEVMSEPMRFTA